MFLGKALNLPKTGLLVFFLLQSFPKNVIKFYPQSKYKECERSFLCLAEEKNFLKEKPVVGRHAKFIITKTALPNIAICTPTAMPRSSSKTVG